MKRLADLITESNYMIAFTGAGISTSAGIPDYRSGQGTMIKTGAGEWEIDPEDRKKRLPGIRSHVQGVI